MPDVFLSYSREDQAVARRFADGLAREGFSVWWDQALSAGQEFDQVTEQALDDAKAVVVLWSKKSVDSRWVRAEATQAKAAEKLVPVMTEACRRPIMFELTHTADLSGWSGDAADNRWQSFVEGLRTFVGSPVEDGRAERRVPDSRDPAGPAAGVAAPRPRIQPLLWAVAAAAVLIAAGLAWQALGRGTAPAPEPAALQLASIAVLPFDDLSPQKDQQYFADGVAEEILNQLARVDARQLRVIARNSSFAFRGGNQNLKQVGESLGVDHLLEGSVRKDGGQLRITAQLIDAKSDAHLWSKTYERPLTDIFAIQDEIARSVAETLQISLGVGIGQLPGMTRNAQAYDAFLAARSATATYSPGDTRRGITLAEEAVRLDPAFAQGWMLLADAYGDMQPMEAEPTEDWQAKSDQALEQVRRLAPSLPALPLLEAERNIQRGNWKEAARIYHDAAGTLGTMGTTRLDSGPVARFLMVTGHTQEAIDQLERARVLDPLNAQICELLVIAYTHRGRFDAAFAEAERGDRLPPQGNQDVIRWFAAAAAVGARDRARIERWLDAQAGPGDRQLAGALKAWLDRPEEARANLRDTGSARPPMGLAGMAPWRAYFGDPEGALEDLRLATQRGARYTAGFQIWLPVFRQVRTEEGFKSLVREMGLVDYWKESSWPEDYCKPTTGDDFECH